MANSLAPIPLLLALAVAAPDSAWADVTYTYTGQNFTSATATWHVPRDLPPGAEEAESARIAAALLSTNLSVAITLPVYLPTGWNSFSFAEILSPNLLTAFATLQANQAVDHPAVSLTMMAAGLSGGGSVGLQGPVRFGDYFSANLLVDSNHRITDWNLSVSGPDLDNSAAFVSTRAGDSTGLSMTPGPRGSLNYSASNAASGSWSVSGSAVSAVPEAPPHAALLMGLGLLGGLAWRSRPRAGSHPVLGWGAAQQHRPQRPAPRSRHTVPAPAAYRQAH